MPYTDIEAEYIHKLRTLIGQGLEKIPDTNNRTWSDGELYLFLTQALADMNLVPPLTTWTLSSTKTAQAISYLMYGGILYGLMNAGIFSIQQEFSYSAKGVSITFDRSSKYQSWINTLLQLYSGFGRVKYILADGTALPPSVGFGEPDTSSGIGIYQLTQIMGLPGRGRSSRTTK